MFYLKTFLFFRTKKCLHVSDLSMKNHKRLNSKSKLYLWNLITVAVFYSLPVVQLVFTFQKVIFFNILYQCRNLKFKINS